ncbi:MAG: hypothetical protein WCP34_16800 [Pseudomonadota bacterium]
MSSPSARHRSPHPPSRRNPVARAMQRLPGGQHRPGNRREDARREIRQILDWAENEPPVVSYRDSPSQET